MAVYVFDMDGTLTPARLPMTAEFAARFYPWQKTHKCFIATGSDYAKVQEQLPENVVNAFTGIYCSMGNTFKVKGKTVYEKNFTPPEGLLERLEFFRKNTKYPAKLFDNYIEQRIGMINFSVLGRDCPHCERARYNDWDKTAGERINIQKQLQQEFPDLAISVGGTISIDITPKGCGKGQIAHHLRQIYPNEQIFFFGDKTFQGGNDYELAMELSQLANTKTIQVDESNFVLNFLQENS